MLLSPTETFPPNKGWLFETKYDGFRCLLNWEDKTPKLISRTGNQLNEHFPELIRFCEQLYDEIYSFLPITLDGEIVYLINNAKSVFSVVQTRGRMKNTTSIKQHARSRPVHYIGFDILRKNGESLEEHTVLKRKQILEELFKTINLPVQVDYLNRARLQAIDYYKESSPLWSKIKNYNGEGIVAKRATSKWESGVRSSNWLKIKNWRYVTVVLTKYDKMNGYFQGSILQDDQWIPIVNFKHGLNEEEERILFTFFQSNGTKVSTNEWQLPPSICVMIACIDFDGKHLREPMFHQFQLDADPFTCTTKQMQRQLQPLPESVAFTHPDKPIWPLEGINKDDYLLYLQKVSTYLLPFLSDRLLTLIRFPHGAEGESFYQKHCPDYAPDFVLTKQVEDINYIICNGMETLLWLGNQLALEFHTPFQTIHTTFPTEIVFDLDPPSVSEFSLAIEAAIRMKAIFDEFNLTSFVKTSGGKGLQVYIPLPDDTFTYAETRIFTQFVCTFLCEQEPQWFTTERLKKNRHNKLYLDYIQHDEGKTIIAPYSTRGRPEGLVATPLHWHEVTSELKPSHFTIPAVIERLKEPDPFQMFHESKTNQPFEKILIQLKDLLT